MQVNEKVELNINEYLEKLIAINNECEKLKDNVPNIVFLNIKDVCKVLGWGTTAVHELFRREDFPSCNIGTMCVERGAFISYFQKKRKKEG